VLTVDVAEVAKTHDTSVIVVVTDTAGREVADTRLGPIDAGDELFAVAAATSEVAR
jgi:beta-glucoside PTS system EIICBA component